LASLEVRRVIVHTHDDRSIEGLLVTVAADGLVLRTAKLLSKGKAVSMGGEVFLYRQEIAMVQTVPVGQVATP
jgi:hypothetical protein